MPNKAQHRRGRANTAALSEVYYITSRDGAVGVRLQAFTRPSRDGPYGRHKAGARSDLSRTTTLQADGKTLDIKLMAVLCLCADHNYKQCYQRGRGPAQHSCTSWSGPKCGVTRVLTPLSGTWVLVGKQ